MRRTLGTAGRTVFFSSITVAAALASLLIFPQRFLYSMGVGGAMVAILAALISLTVLPAVLALLGERVNSLAPASCSAARRVRPRRWRAASGTGSRFVMRRPAIVAIASASLLIALGLPFLRIEFTAPDSQILPEERSARQVDDTLRAEFPPNRDTPIRVLIGGATPAAIERVSAELAATEGVIAVNPPRRLASGDAMLEAISAEPYVANGSRETVRAIRELPAPAGTELLVTGATASFLDYQQSLAEHLPLAVGIIVGATLIVLFLMTGSVVLPLKQLLMNLLNLSAVFGILVLIFQDGRLQGLLDYRSQDAVEQTMPILLFAVAFGLSTDYGVFLLSRIKEARDGGAGDNDAVAIGLERTGRIVTAAALLFAIAIGAFASSELIFIKQNGIGTALAVLIDATIIRALLVPSVMALLGHWNWWAPRPLRRLYWRLGVSESLPEGVGGRDPGQASGRA